jgi:translin
LSEREKVLTFLSRRVDRALKELKKKEDEKRKVTQLGDEIIKASREVVSSVHRKDLKFASKEIVKLKAMTKVFHQLTCNSKLTDWGYAVQVYQEFFEALALFSIITGDSKSIVKEINLIPSLSLLLGLSDLIGELRREIISNLMEQKIEEAKDLLDAMQEIYNNLQKTPLPESVAPGLRRKIDVNRTTIEASISDLYQEIRSLRLQKKLDEFYKTSEKS